MKQAKTSLFVVIDPSAPQQLALVKAFLIAKLGSCHIHAFLCIHENMAGAEAFAAADASREESLQRAADWLDDLLHPCRLSGVPYTTEIEWDENWIDALVRAVARSDCDLVIKSSYEHSQARRMFSKTSDYHLMRNCVRPILFTHQSQDWKSDRILACLDLESTDSAHSRLNRAILEDSRAFAAVVGMDLYLACAFGKAIDAARLGIEAGGGVVSAEQLGEHFDVAAERVLLRQGDAVPALQAICEEIDPSIVVLGTLARSGVSGKLIGNTAEKLLDIVDADLLTVY
jgi:universal stress protein E